MTFLIEVLQVGQNQCNPCPFFPTKFFISLYRSGPISPQELWCHFLQPSQATLSSVSVTSSEHMPHLLSSFKLALGISPLGKISYSLREILHPALHPVRVRFPPSAADSLPVVLQLVPLPECIV